jgi:nucleoid DNA-binding protein
MARKKATTKTTARKTTAKKAAPARKKAAAAKTTVKKAKALPLTAIQDPYNKTKTLEYIATATELSKKEVSKVFETLNNLVHRHMKKKSAGEFTIPGLMKLVVKSKPATKARKGTNPFTGEEMMFKAKPARRIIKVRALKKLKEMAE